MSMDTAHEVGETATQTGRTLIELTERDDGSWTATQPDVAVEGTGETAPLAAMDYCRTVAEQ